MNGSPTAIHPSIQAPPPLQQAPAHHQEPFLPALSLLMPRPRLQIGQATRGQRKATGSAPSLPPTSTPTYRIKAAASAAEEVRPPPRLATPPTPASWRFAACRTAAPSRAKRPQKAERRQTARARKTSACSTPTAHTCCWRTDPASHPFLPAGSSRISCVGGRRASSPVPSRALLAAATSTNVAAVPRSLRRAPPPQASGAERPPPRV